VHQLVGKKTADNIKMLQQHGMCVKNSDLDLYKELLEGDTDLFSPGKGGGKKG
jgi:hypothetical protein